MKYLFSVIVLLAFQIELCAQAAEAPKSNLEKFQERTSSLVLKEYVDISYTRTLTIQVVKIAVLPDKKETASGVLISWGTTSIGVFQETGNAFLDGDEIDEVVKGIDAMLKMIGGTIPANYTELELTTRSSLKLTLFPSKTAWNIALEHVGHRQYIYTEDLAKIRESLVNAKSKL